MTPHPKGPPVKTVLPKLARDLANLIGISRKETDLDKLTTALDEARGQILAATRDREAAEAAYRDGLLDATPADLEKLLVAKGRATVDLDRAEALTAALVNRIASVREAAEQDRRRALHDDAVTKCADLRKRLAPEYAHHAGALRALLRDLAAAEVARERAEAEAPELPRIASPEIEVRGMFSVPEEIIERKEVELWVYLSHADPIPDDVQRKVQQQQGSRDRGYYTPPGHLEEPRDCGVWPSV